MIKVLVIIVLIAVASVLSSMNDSIHPEEEEDFVIDFDMVGKFDEGIKAVDERELRTAFELYLDSTGFDEMVERYSKNVHEALEKRLKDSLIIG